MVMMVVEQAHGRMRSATSVVRPDIDTYGVPMENELANGNGMPEIAEQGDAVDAEYNYDIDAEDDDDDNDAATAAAEVVAPTHFGMNGQSGPTLNKRKSITEMVAASLGAEFGDDMDGMDMAGGVGGADMDDDDDGIDADEAGGWMEAAKQWIAKEKSLKEQIVALTEDLEEADATLRSMEIDHEKAMSSAEEETNAMKAAYEERLHNMEQDHMVAAEKLNLDNSTMARDVHFLTNEVATQKAHIEELERRLKDSDEELQTKISEWRMHQTQCPLLNEEISRQIEEKHSTQVRRYKLDSQQMDASIAKLVHDSKTMEDDLKEVRDKNSTQQTHIEQLNAEVSRLREECDKLSKARTLSAQALEELHARTEEEQRRALEVQQEYQRLGNEYDMLLAYSNEQAQVLEMAEFAPTGVDPSKFEAVKNKKLQFQGGRDSTRSFVRSMGGLSDVLGHIKTLSNVSDALRSGAMKFGGDDLKQDDDTDIQSQSSYATSTDIGSIASHFTRFSFQAYHTHDASKEFFFLLSLCVKLSLANKYGVSPDVAPSHEQLWKQALANNIKFHEYYEFLHNELTSLYEYKFKMQQAPLQNVVITERRHIQQMQDKRNAVKALQQNYANQSFLYNQYDNVTKGDESVQHRLHTIKDRTYFSPNDHLFGGNVKVTTRSNRAQHLQSHRSSLSSKSKKRHSKKHRHSHQQQQQQHKKHRSSVHEEPGNDTHHPLNDDDKQRNSQKLSHNASQDHDQKESFHLTQKSLESLDPAKNHEL